LLNSEAHIARRSRYPLKDGDVIDGLYTYIFILSFYESTGQINITKELKDKELIAINIPNVKAKVILNLDEVKENISMITAIKGAKDQRVGFIERNIFTPIDVYESDAKGAEATKGNEKITYAIVKDKDLIIKTNHFTNFVSYSVSQQETVKPFDLKNLYANTQLISNWAMEAIREASQKAFIDGSNGKFT
jgi:hypothetical protein